MLGDRGNNIGYNLSMCILILMRENMKAPFMVTFKRCANYKLPTVAEVLGKAGMPVTLQQAVGTQLSASSPQILIASRYSKAVTPLTCQAVGGLLGFHYSSPHPCLLPQKEEKMKSGSSSVEAPLLFALTASCCCAWTCLISFAGRGVNLPPI